MVQPIPRQGIESLSLGFQQVGGAVEAQSSVQAVAARMNPNPVVQLNTSAELTQDPNISRSFEAISRLGSATLAPYVQAAAQEQFMAGVQKAMTGQALKEVVDEQPVWSRVFGDSNAVQGARAYTVQDQLNRATIDIETKMPELAKQSPEAMRQYAVGMLQGFMTGDAQADGLIQGELAKGLAPLFRRHAKEHLAYNQVQASLAQSRSISSSLDRYQQIVQEAQQPGATYNPQDVLNAKGSVLQAMQPFGGQSDESLSKIIANAVADSASRGNFHGVRALEEAGAWDKMDPSVRDTVARQLRGFAVEARGNLLPNYIEEIIAIEQGAEANGTEWYLAQAKALNERFSNMTGIKETGLITEQQMATRALSHAERVARENASNLSREQKNAANDAAERAAIQDLVAKFSKPGAVAVARDQGTATGAQISVAGDIVWAQAQTAPARAALIISNNGVKDLDAAKRQFTGMWYGEKMNTLFAANADILARLPEELQSEILGKDKAKFKRFSELTSAKVDPETAYVMAQAEGNTLGTPVGVTPVGERATALRGASSGFEYTPVGATAPVQLNAASARLLETAASRYYDDERRISNPETAAKVALHMARSNGIGLFGSNAFIESGTLRPLRSEIPLGTVKDYDAAFTDTLAVRLKAVGADETLDHMLIRVPQGDTSRFLIMGYKTDGTPVRSYFDASEVNDLIRKRVQFESRPTPTGQTQSGLTLGTPIRNKPGTPSIYASPEEWAAFRKSQQ